MSDDYLWNRSGAPDPEIERLEEALGTYRYDRSAPSVHAQARRRWWPWTAAAAVVVLGLALALRGHEAGPPSTEPDPVDATTARAAWPCEVEGDPGAVCSTTPGQVAVGEWIETGRDERARVTVADIGTLTVRENSRIGLLKTGADEHRMRLERGAIHAVVNAPPRLFIVETPAAQAVDLGCEYTLEVDDEGNGRLVVLSGRVALERDGRSALVPYDATCRIRASGPGTPVFVDAPRPLRAALDTIDFGEHDAGDLDTVIASARTRDTLTLFHLLPRYQGPARERIYDRMAALAPPPRGVTRTGTLALDETMLAEWLEELRWEAWDAPAPPDGQPPK